MFEFNGFSRRTNLIINHSISLAASFGHTYIGSEHLLLGILKDGSGPAFHALSGRNVTFLPCKEALIRAVGKGSPSCLTNEDFTPRCKKILENATVIAGAASRPQVGPEELLTAILREPDCRAGVILKGMGTSPDQLLLALQALPGGECASDSLSADKRTRGAQPQRPVRTSARTNLLDRYSRDLTDQARFGRLDPVVGRDKEISRVVQILSRRTKNNPCILGEAGVGKTAIAEGLAQAIVAGKVPSNLKHTRLLSLDLSSMVAGTKYRGDFEERIKSIVEEVIAAGNIVLFIDEIHNIIGTGAAEGAIDAANILKPQLARGELQVVGATTLAEYRKYIEKDAALERRFQSVSVEEPTEDMAITILKGLRSNYERHHGLGISDEAIKAAVALSVRYQPDRRLPDKAIDLLDESAARLRLTSVEIPPNIEQLEERLQATLHKKESAVCGQDYELAATLRDVEQSLRTELACARRMWRQRSNRDTLQVTSEDIAELMAEITGIDSAVITEDQSLRLLRLEELLHNEVVGQEEAVGSVARAIRRNRVGLRDPHKPIGSFLFLGPTGVGKTQLSKALSHNLFGDEKSLVRLDMTEYMEGHSLSKLIGTPPGYVGFDQGSHAFEQIRRKPYSVVLFDEVEKAHPDIWGILLQAMDNGVVTDAQGRKINFRNTVIILTSNLGYQHITEGREFGFGNADTDQRKNVMKKSVMAELRKTFRPEFINRLDDIIIFEKLSRVEVGRIAGQFLSQVTRRLLQRGIAAEFSQEMLTALTDQGFDQQYGARPLHRAVQTLVEDPLSTAILKGDLKSGERVRCGYSEGLTIEKLQPAVKS